jgi:hypothetical protein
MDMSEFKIIPEPVMYVDATPDDMYPLRILRAYRENCNSKFATDSEGNCDNVLFQIMNDHCDQRAKVLDKAIEILEKYYINK